MSSARTIKQVLTYGNGVVLACFGVMFLLYGSVLNTFTIFVDPIVKDFETTRGLLSVAMMIGAIGMGVSAPVAGILMDRVGVRRVMIAGTLMVGLGILAASRATTLFHMYVVYAFIGCGLASATIIACSLIVSNWFVSRRGMAMGVMAMGTSTGGMVMGPVASWIIQNHSWRAAYLFSGSMILLVGLPLVIFIIKPRPSDAGLDPYVDPGLPSAEADTSWGLTVKEAFSTSAFWQIAALMFIIGLVTSGLGMHIVPSLTDMHHSPARAVGIWSIALGVMTVSKFLFGPIADRVGPKNAIAAACALMAVSIVILSFAVRYEVAIVAGALYGFGVGAPLTVNPLLVGKSLGVKHFGAIYGVLNLISIIGAAFGPVSLGFIDDALKSYLLGLYAFSGLMAVTVVIALFINSDARDASEALRPQPADAID